MTRYRTLPRLPWRSARIMVMQVTGTTDFYRRHLDHVHAERVCRPFLPSRGKTGLPSCHAPSEFGPEFMAGR